MSKLTCIKIQSPAVEQMYDRYTENSEHGDQHIYTHPTSAGVPSSTEYIK